MKKIICVIVIAVITILSISTFSNANSITPEYDATFDNGKGIFYANGTPITINKDGNGDTVVSWDGGQQIVNPTVRIVGGGKEGTSFSESSITMEDGIVSFIYGGGASLDQNNLAIVGNGNVIINGGTVLQTLYGGGLLFTTTTTSNVTINNGLVKSVCGGGGASASIAGVSYSAGIATDLQNSKCRVETANIMVNGGKIDTEPSISGSIFGGGQGYSYVQNSNILITDGDLSNAYLVGGGSNGYTGNVDMRISGGTIKVLQTVNRGEMENAIVRIDGGLIETVYIGGENDPGVTGTISSVDFAALSGLITNLLPGVSGGTPLIVNQEEYKAVTVQGIVENSEIGEQEVQIEYNFNIIEDSIKINKGEVVSIETQIITIPDGYEYLFNNENIGWIVLDSNIVTVDQNGNATGISKGNTIITAEFLDTQDTVQIEVLDLSGLIFMLVIILAVVVLLIWGYFIFNFIF